VVKEWEMLQAVSAGYEDGVKIFEMFFLNGRLETDLAHPVVQKLNIKLI